MDWFLYDNGPRHERVKLQLYYNPVELKRVEQIYFTSTTWTERMELEKITNYKIVLNYKWINSLLKKVTCALLPTREELV